jgi:two-component system, LytTR family, sensor kinase
MTSISAQPRDLDLPESAPARVPNRPWRLVLAVTLPVWAYLTLSRVAMFNLMTAGYPDIIIAPPHLRVWQHILMLPILVVFYRVALAIGWPEQRRWRAACLHFGLAVTFALAARPVLVTLVATSKGDPALFDELLRSVYGTRLSFDLWASSALDFFMSYCFGLLVLLGVQVYRQLRDQQLHVARLEQAWSRARLESLRMQLNPHFLFNALNAAVSLVRASPARAEDMLIRLADLLRVALRDGAQDFTTVAREVELARGYLEVQRARMADRLHYSISVEPGANSCSIPSLLLQPLVENAVLHAAASDLDTVAVELRVECVQRELHIFVRNTAPLVPPTFASATGIGLRNTRERLATLYGSTHRFSIQVTSGGDVEASIVIPAHRSVRQLDLRRA